MKTFEYRDFLNQGETPLIRDEVLKIITPMMNGLDLGSAGGPVIPQAISVDRANGHFTDLVQYRCDVSKLSWLTDESMDYVFSSHCLEDFPPEQLPFILAEWIRVIKPGGYLMLYLPNEQKYRQYCLNNGSQRNLDHKDPNFSSKTILKAVPQGMRNIKTIENHKAYSFFIVFQKQK